ncbi:DNA-binding MarR family transcriptional regulator [Paucibacter oligotrophus]|uniref:DNA-binding MarR family transcriptional regulator n=1 Tax=Roseateles oligotrophus TaxID=1769250 RepID=A0A840LB10_9BURK|nr:MarR family transcriptional regulator [Roseateles oligotrophus]MBB4843832.1 DNA-binding MarR family transcriptional regulator [Roseateles oligotrophus]
MDTLELGPDLESRVQGQDQQAHQALRLWLRLLSCTTRVEGVIRKRLAQDFATTLPRFDLLAQLERHPQGLSMRELSKRLMVTGGNITGITDQLEAEGLVLRALHPSDRRSFSVKLTPLGRRQFKRMASTHEQWVLELLGGWSAEQQEQVHGLLADLKQHLAALEAAQQEQQMFKPSLKPAPKARTRRKQQA